MNDDDPKTVAHARELIERGAYGEAEAVLLRVVEDVKLRLGEEACELIVPLYRLAEAMSKQRPWNVFPPKEKEVLERALCIARNSYGDESAQATRIRETLAASLRAADETEDAAQHMRVVVRAKERIHGEGILLAHALNGLAEMLLALEKHADAAAAYERAFAMAGDRGDETMDFIARFGRGRALVSMGHNSEAIPLLERALERCLKRYGERNKVTVWVREWLERAQQGLD
jgi:tetratricopeptide (TPR) repeat protein